MTVGPLIDDPADDRAENRVADPNGRRTAATVLRHEAYPVYPWRNGRGRVRHIADGEGWQLRLADITESGPFSDYAGHHRLFAIVEGAVVLEMPDGRRVHCDPGSPIAAFDGGMAPDCSLVTGPARALNLIARSDQVLASLERRRIGQADTAAIEAGGAFVAIHVESGQVECAREGFDARSPAASAECVAARAGDTLMLPAAAGLLLRAGRQGAGAVVLVGRIETVRAVPPTPSP